jgi:hypothetical protein
VAHFGVGEQARRDLKAQRETLLLEFSVESLAKLGVGFAPYSSWTVPRISGRKKRY